MNRRRFATVSSVAVSHGTVTCGPKSEAAPCHAASCGELAPCGETEAAAEDTALSWEKAFAGAAVLPAGAWGRLNWLKPVCGAGCRLGLR